MTAVLLILGLLGALAVMILKALVVKELLGSIDHLVAKSVEKSIARLPADLQDRWAEEWRADLAAFDQVPMAAARFAWRLRKSASDLCTEVPATTSEGRLRKALRALRSARGWTAGALRTEVPALVVPCVAGVVVAVFSAFIVALAGVVAVAFPFAGVVAVVVLGIAFVRSPATRDASVTTTNLLLGGVAIATALASGTVVGAFAAEGSIVSLAVLAAAAGAAATVIPAGAVRTASHLLRHRRQRH